MSWMFNLGCQVLMIVGLYMYFNLIVYFKVLLVLVKLSLWKLWEISLEDLCWSSTVMKTLISRYMHHFINDMKYMYMYVIQNSNFRAPLHVHVFLLSTKLHFSSRPWVVSLWGCVRWEPGVALMSSTGWRRECCPPSPSRSRPYRKPSKTWLAKRRRVWCILWFLYMLFAFIL